jgi:serine protease Do
MLNRTRMLATLLTVALLTTLVGAIVTTERHRHGGVAISPPSTEHTAARPVVKDLGSSREVFGLETFRNIAHSYNDGVVNINTSRLVRLPRFRDPFHDFFGDDGERSFGPDRQPGRMRQTSLGSGFVVDADGYVLTNRHVIEGADEISVTFPNGRTYEAKVVGRDARTDVALVKIEPKEALTVLPLGNSDRVQVGEWVMAVGNPFGLGGNSVTVGVVSYKGRDLELGAVPHTSVEMLQTDAAINPGNSGGPLLNTDGEVIGINTMIVTDGMSRANAGVGFSVPINVASEILPQLRATGKVVRGWMGVTIGAMTQDLAATYGLDEATGTVVNSVNAGSPAEKAGIEPEDVILAADGHAIEDNSALSRYVASKAPGTVVDLDVLRDGKRRKVSVTLGTFPEDPTNATAGETDRPRLGMSLRDLTPDLADRLGLPPATRGALVTEVEPGSPAERALRPRDVIVSVNGESVKSVEDFERALAGAQTGGRVRLRVLNAQGYRVTVLELK